MRHPKGCEQTVRVTQDQPRTKPRTSKLHTAIVVIAILASIYLQRLALPGTSVGLGAAVPYLGLAALGIARKLKLPQRDFILGLLLFTALGLSTILAGLTLPANSASLALVVLMWAPFMFMIDRQNIETKYLLRAFQYGMFPVAILTILQFVLQSSFPQWLDPVSLLPKTWLVPGYQAAYEFQYGSGVLKANGVFFLESSFASQYLAVAALAALSARRWMSPLFILALVVTGGGTGIIMLLIGLAVYVARGSSRTKVVAVGSVVIGVLVMSWLGLAEQILGRAGEINGENTSGSQRFVAPFDVVGAAFGMVPNSFFWGLGPGSANPFGASIGVTANFSLIPKLMIEYGVMPALFFTVLLIAIIRRIRLDIALKLPIGVMMLFLSGALIQAHTSVLLWALYVGLGSAHASSPGDKPEPLAVDENEISKVIGASVSARRLRT